MIIHIVQWCKSGFRPTVRVTKFLQYQQNQLLQRRNCSMMRTSDKMEQLLKKKDHMPERCELIYRQKNFGLQGVMYLTANFCAFVCLGGGIYYAYRKYQDPSYSMYEGMEETPYQNAAFILVNLMMVIVSNSLRSRWPLRIYRDPNKGMYKALFLSRTPFFTELQEFPEKTLSYASKDSNLPWKTVLFKIEDTNRKIFLFDNNFRTHNDFYQMLRADQIHV